jgi:hypothetical protein
MRTICAFFLAAASLAAAAPAHAIDRYVSKAGSDGSMTCSEAAPCLTVGWAFNRAGSGDTVRIGPGTFEEEVDTGTVETLHVVGAGAGPVDGFDAGAHTRILGRLEMQAGGSVRNIRLQGSSLREGLVLNATNAPASYTVEDAVAIGSVFGNSGNDQPAVEVASPTNALDVQIRRTVATGGTDMVRSGPAIDVQGAGVNMTFEESQALAPEARGLIVGAGASAAVARSRLTGDYAAIADNSPSFTVTRSRLEARFQALGVQSGSQSSTATVADSLLTAGDVGNGAGIFVNTGNAGFTSTLTLRRSTAVTQGADGVAGVEIGGVATGAGALNLEGSVVRATASTGTASDIRRSAAGTATFQAQHSSFTTATGDGTPAPGSGSNIAGDPQIDSDGRLLAGSPLIDRGDATGLDANSLDLDGNPRSQDGDADAACTPVPDIGAFERAAAACTVPPEEELPPPPDTEAPVISGLGLTHDVFAPVAGRAAAAGRRVPRGTKLRFDLSEAATVKVAVQRRKGKRWRAVGTLTRAGQAGRNRIRFGGRLRGRALRPRRYRAVLRATDAAGNRSQAARVRFRVVRAPKRR